MNILLNATATSFLSSPIFMFLIIILIMYFMMIRPQRKRQKEIENFRNGLQVGQNIITSGGIYGKVKSVDGQKVKVEIARDVVVDFDKSAIYADSAAAQQYTK